MDEDKRSQRPDDNLDEELAKQLQAEEENAEDASGEEEGEEEHDQGLAGLSQDELKMFEQITKENMRAHLAEAVAHKKANNYDRALQILKIILMKGEALHGDPMHYDLAICYYSMGSQLLSNR